MTMSGQPLLTHDAEPITQTLPEKQRDTAKNALSQFLLKIS